VASLTQPLNPFTVPCRYCHADAGCQCVSTITGKPLRKGLAHPSRIHDAYPDLEPEDGDDAE